MNTDKTAMLWKWTGMRVTDFACWCRVFVLGLMTCTARADVTADWTNDTDGAWSIGSNWSGGNAATGTTGVANFTNTITAARTVTVDASPWTINSITFTNNSVGNAYGWTITGGTLNLAGTTPTLYVNGVASTATVASVLSGNAGLTKDGAGTLVLEGSNTYTGTTKMSNGTLTIHGTLNGTSLNQTTNTATFLYSGTGSTVIDSINTAASYFGLISIVNGTFAITGNVQLANSQSYNTAPTLAAPVAASTANGFYINGASAVVTVGGQLQIGTAGSSCGARIDAGSLTVTGKVTVGKTMNTSRWNILQVNGGTFTVVDTVTGVQIAPNGSVAQRAEVYLSGGTSTIGKITFGADTDTMDGTGFLILGGGNLYVGSGGIVKATPRAGYGYTNGLNSGLLGASADWSSSLDMWLGANPTIQAADAAGTAHNITLSGTLRGAGFTKTGAGCLTLSGTNTCSGMITVNNGVLMNNGVVTGAVTVAAGGTLGGTGTVAGIVTNSGVITAGNTDSVGVMTLTDLVMAENANCVWNYAGGTGDTIVVNGSLTLPTHATVTVSQVSGRMPAAGVLFTGFASVNTSDLSAWVIHGADRPTRAIVIGNQVSLVASGGFVIIIR